ncbi:hypothetical protein I3259_06615, partial [Photobacterium sp. Ph5]|nr:hypothetical protein [Photobacterium sp. Ph5]
EKPTPPASPDANNGWGDLVVPDDFDFNTSYDLSITINLKTTETLSIAIYHDFNQLDTGDIIPIAASQLVSGTILNGDFNGVIRVTSSMNSILILLFNNNGSALFYSSIQPTTPDGIIIIE